NSCDGFYIVTIAIKFAHAHAAEADGRNLRAVNAQAPPLHMSSPFDNWKTGCGRTHRLFDLRADELRDESGAGQLDSAPPHPRDELFADVINESDLRQVHQDRTARLDGDCGPPAFLQFLDPRAYQFPLNDEDRRRILIARCDSEHRRSPAKNRLKIAGDVMNRTYRAYS